MRIQIKTFLKVLIEKLHFLDRKLKNKKPWILIFIISFLLSDLLVLLSHGLFLPSKELPARKLTKGSNVNTIRHSQYKAIWKENIFHTGPIPTQLFEESVSEEPVKTNLPFSLKGTIVHANPRRSVATVKGRKTSRSYQVGDSIEEQAEILQIERRRIIFINSANGQKEFLEIPKQKKSAITYVAPVLKVPEQKSLVQKFGGDFKLHRSDVKKYLKKLPEILNQARMVPNIIKKGGQEFMHGWRFASIQKGSVYEDLGFKVGDVITEVEGEPVDSAEKALELYNKFQTSSHVEIVVNDQPRTYTVKEDAPID